MRGSEVQAFLGCREKEKSITMRKRYRVINGKAGEKAEKRTLGNWG